jgi:hypothetical protein
MEFIRLYELARLLLLIMLRSDYEEFNEVGCAVVDVLCLICPGSFAGQKIVNHWCDDQ